MKTQTYNWGNRSWTFYKPKENKKRKSILAGLILGDLILPATFGLGFLVTKLILKVNPLYLYR